jgi:hypothetical protein
MRLLFFCSALLLLSLLHASSILHPLIFSIRLKMSEKGMADGEQLFGLHDFDKVRIVTEPIRQIAFFLGIVSDVFFFFFLISTAILVPSAAIFVRRSLVSFCGGHSNELPAKCFFFPFNGHISSFSILFFPRSRFFLWTNFSEMLLFPFQRSYSFRSLVSLFGGHPKAHRRNPSSLSSGFDLCALWMVSS